MHAPSLRSPRPLQPASPLVSAAFGFALLVALLWGSTLMAAPIPEDIAPAKDLQGAELEQFNCEHRKFMLQGACKGGDLRSCYQYGICFQRGWGTDLNLEEALKIYNKACKAGDSYACNGMGRMYEEGQGVEANWDNAFSAYAEACEKKDAFACSYLGIRLYDGVRTPPDLKKSKLFLEKGCEQGFERACDDLQHSRFYSDTQRTEELSALLVEVRTAMLAAAMGLPFDKKWNGPDSSKNKDLRAVKDTLKKQLGASPKVLLTLVKIQTYLTRAEPDYSRLGTFALLLPDGRLRWSVEASIKSGRPTRELLGAGTLLTEEHPKALYLTSNWSLNNMLSGECKYHVLDKADLKTLPEYLGKKEEMSIKNRADHCKLMSSVVMEDGDYWTSMIRFFSLVLEVDGEHMVLIAEVKGFDRLTLQHLHLRKL